MPKKILLAFAILGVIYILGPLLLQHPSSHFVQANVIVDSAKKRRTSSVAGLKVSAALQKDSVVPKGVAPDSENHELLKVNSGTPVSFYSETEAYCRLKKSNVQIPLGDGIKILTSASFISEGHEGSRKVTVKSPQCPHGTYSEVEFNLNHEVLTVSDCRDLTLEDLVVRDGLSTTFNNPEESPPGGLNLASAMGLFVAQCPSGVEYSREGRFKLNNGQLKNSKECLLLDRNNQPLVLKETSKPAENGCFENGQCMALVEPGATHFEVLDDKDLLATGNPRDILVAEENAFVMEGSVSVHDEVLGLTGKNWKEVGEFVPPRLCPE